MKLKLGMFLIAALLFASSATKALAWSSKTCPSGQTDTLPWVSPIAPSGQGTNFMETNNFSRIYTNIYQPSSGIPGSPNTIREIYGAGGADGGYDMPIYDSNYIYYWANIQSADGTVAAWFNKYSAPAIPRCFTSGSPGYSSALLNLTLTYTNAWGGGSGCSPTQQTAFKYVNFQLWGPYNLSLGGNLPANNPTLILTYIWNLTSTGAEQIGSVREQQDYQQGYGLVHYENANWNGSSWVNNSGALRDWNYGPTAGSSGILNPCASYETQ